MEKKQLNLNQPLLSVRRIASSALSPKAENRNNNGSFPSIPPRTSYYSELKSGPVQNPGNVPFVWEHSPGRPKDGTCPQIHPTESPSTVPKLPPGRTPTHRKMDSVEDTSIGKGPGKETMGMQMIKSSKEITGGSDSDDGDEAFMDALDTLSRSESSFYNCSATGYESDAKKYPTDPKTREFMMGRFLPAAKAMASEAPQHAPRKQPRPMVNKEQPRKLVNVNGDKQPKLRYGPSFAKNFDDGNVEDDSDDDYEEYRNTTFKGCGLLPRFCLKGSFGLLNAVPGISVRTRVPVSPQSRSPASSSSAASSSEIVLEPPRSGMREQRSIGGVAKNSLRESHQVSDQNNSQNLEGSTLYKRLQGGRNVSTDSNELSQSSFSEVEEFLSYIPVEEKLLADGTNNMDNGSPTVEKTLYVDIVHKVESPKPNLYLPDLKAESVNGSEVKSLAQFKESEDNPSARYVAKGLENLNIAEGLEKSKSNTQKSNHIGMLKDENQYQGRDRHQGIRKDAKSYENENALASGDEGIDFEYRHNSLEENSKNSGQDLSEFPAPPPLPKSPSDSWLWRTLPSVSTKNNTSSNSCHPITRNPAPKATLAEPKWEKLVQTTNAQHQSSRYSQGLLTPISEN